VPLLVRLPIPGRHSVIFCAVRMKAHFLTDYVRNSLRVRPKGLAAAYSDEVLSSQFNPLS
jgi:hypothetical protein